MNMILSWSEVIIKGIVCHFGKYAFSLSSWELDENIDTALISVHLIWGYSQQPSYV